MHLPARPLSRPVCPALSLLDVGLEEVCAAGPRDMAAALAFVLSRVGRDDGRGAALIATRAWIGEHGRPYGPGLAVWGRCDGFVLVTTRTPTETLWAMEQALRSGGLGVVLGAVDTAELAQTRRLDFAGRAGASSGVLLRARAGDLSAARRRWRITTKASVPGLDDPRAPGRATLSAELTRSRTERPGTWMLEQDDETYRLRLADRLAGDGLGERGRAGLAA